ncbi:transglutaminase family protein [Rhizobium sp. TRM95796]|uniref:transglutaminase family protein n=1 Tax=Rhizobium sp. TRM95796 TaxID=2979862 RepID=UPI0021E9ADA4|nr:transglutaminase family protein [Rhizobium sp. TRM95796]MCV3764944.1 transglutaminase family protein [Rhizobium sp. TRM95796]
MRLKISHMTEYNYDEPVEFALQRLRLTPRDWPGQKVLAWQTLVTGAGHQAFYDDHFGNRVELVSVIEGQTSIRIMAQGEVETEELHGVFGPHKGHAPLWLFRRETTLAKPGKLVRDLAKGIEGESDLARMHALMAAIHDAVAYKKGVTTSETTAEQALELGAGVCQDHAHVFIAAARLIGLPARYVSGYMLDGSDMAAASHAWAEAHVDGLGWVGFDAANKICPDERYVRVASGLDYTDTAPVSGMRLGTSPEMIIVNVTVEQ